MMKGVLACACLLALLALVGAQNQPVVPFPASFNCTDCEIVSWAFPTPTSLIIVTQDGKVWSSLDSGVSWAPILRWNKISSIVQQNNSTLYFFPWTGNNFFYSTNGGVTIVNASWPVAMGQVQVESFQPHPTQSGWLMFAAAFQTSQTASLYVSKNYGQNWTLYLQNGLDMPPFIQWGNSTSNPDLVFAIDKNNNFIYTNNYGQTSPFQLIQNAAGLVQTQHYQFVATTDGPKIWLYASSYRADPTHTSRGSYKLAEFPTGDNIPNGYTFLDDTTRAEYLGVHVSYPSGTQPQWGTIYSSEFDGAFYTMSADYIYYNNGAFDFHRFRSLAGIYIANFVPNWQQLNEPADKKTIITFDNGGEWIFLDAPNADMNGNPFYCPDPSIWGCSLHLHPDTSSPSTIPGLSFPGWRTHSSAVGMIIANGNVGNKLSYTPSEVSTFLSRDGGLTWAQIVQEATVFEFGDHGGVLVMAPAMTLTSYVLYSYDMGNTTTLLTFTTNTSQFIYVTSIFTEPNGNGLQFIINGYNNQTTEAWYIYTIDLSVFPLRQCGDSDFETFIPSNGNQASCFMGATTTYTRRKQSSVCNNKNQFSDTIISQTPCPCTIEDYECDWNYQRNFSGSGQLNCSLITPVTWCEDGADNYYVQTGYTLVPDTLCDPTLPGAVNLVATQKACPKKKHPAEVAAAVIVTLLVVGSVVAVGVLYWKNDRFRNWILSFRGSSQRYSTINNE